MKTLIHTFQTHLGLIDTAVSLDVPQALLRYAKQAERSVFGDAGWDVFMIELDLDFLLIGELLAKCFDTGNKSQALKRGRMQTVGQGVKVSSKFADIIRQFANASGPIAV
jgi:hypothetical protein